MNCSRRTFIFGIAPVATTFLFGIGASAGQLQSSRQDGTLPGLTNRPDANPSPSDPPAADPLANPRPMLERNQREIQQDIKKLYSLAEQLKQQVDKTNSADVLSLNLVDNAKKIEDLAKQIKNLAKASQILLSDPSHYRAVQRGSAVRFQE